MKINVFSKAVIVVAFAVMSLCAGASAPAPQPKPDTLREIDILRKVFDANYKGPYDDPLRLAQTPAAYPDWDDAYFSREMYRKRLEKVISRDWSVGPFFWQASVKVRPKDELVRGGPIYFMVVYPAIDFRNNLVFSVAEGADGKTAVKIDKGAYYAQRHSYIVATFIVLGYLAVVLFGLAVLARYSYRFAVWAIESLAEKLAPGRGHEQWVRRFSACVLGAGTAFVISVVIELIH